MVEFTQKEMDFLKRNEVCRVATSHGDIPHVTPVNYILIDGHIFFATDYDTRKYKNLEKNKKIAVAVDVYGGSMENQAVIVQGEAEIVDEGEEFNKVYKIFYEKFDWVRQDPWKEREAPFVKVNSSSKVSLGFD